MINRIQASFATILEQSPDVVDYHLSRAINSIDDHFGEGFAKQNPGLVAALITACVSEYNSTTQVKVYASALDNIASALEKIANSRE